MPSRRVSLLKSSQVGQLLTYAGAGAVAGLAILAAIYPERAMFNEKRPDITRPNEWPIIGLYT
ncbi:hypothetical protein BC936DRAFT_140154 [Jimgerdemannia flammicorona]|uniref:Uncharacterized protein n=1 Tax=Jimgerdemannia flammicorona TaxID=994334 RepID=A0A433AZ41_9FUNG|nr:hypothetical protein BC936DRAFT_140154 [Jimgerdemannia flammicorona]